MKILLFSPYGPFHREAGVLYLMANYIKGLWPDISQLRCNGVFSVCERDSESNFQRTIHSCFRCMSEQHRLAAWAKLRSISLSHFLQPADVEDTRHFVAGLAGEELPAAQIQGVALYPLCEHSFQTRFGLARPDGCNQQHEFFLRRLMVSAGRMLLAADNLLQKSRPNCVFVAGGQDYLTRSFVEQLRRKNSNAYVFCLDFGGRGVKVTKTTTGESINCDLLLDDICSMRADFRSWPEELLQIVDEVLRFTNLAEGQLELPIAQ